MGETTWHLLKRRYQIYILGKSQKNENDPQLKIIQKQIMEEEKSKRAQTELKLKEEQMRQQIKKKNEKRDHTLEHRRKGRAIMTKYYLQENKQTQKEVTSQSIDHDEKYFQEDFDMANDINQ
eukprot:TRINITY_DN10240_c0_g1_i1.p1 TRINITY_DN10240_c0_g1~~TRINITY_DN10240_c0_g1_i1.p1  ORF type:complete len:122 (+),score=22.40 TRINITY_DN10240_c0_g1_i1:157-522(+)